MIYEFYDYIFKLDERNNIHVYEYKENCLRYFDKITGTEDLIEYEFQKLCREWHDKNVSDSMLNQLSFNL